MKASNPYLKLELNIFNKLHIMNLIEDLGYEGFGTFIAVKILMAENEHFPVDYVKLVAKNLDIDSEYLQKLMNRKDLFYIKDGEYINDEVLDNLATVAIKSENGEKAARIRWEKEKAKKEAAAKAAKQKDTGEPLPDAAQIQSNDEIITSIIDSYNTVFNKKYVASEDSKEIITDIINKNKNIFNQDPLKQWQIVFSNASRGWEIKGKKKIPDFKTILERWDTFFNGEGYLAPDTEKIKAQNEHIAKLEIEAEKQLDSNIETTLFVCDEYRNSSNVIKLEAQKIYTAEFEKVCDEEAAIKKVILYFREQVQDA